jgi:hypothetical protein
MLISLRVKDTPAIKTNNMKKILLRLGFVEFYISIGSKTLTNGSCPKHREMLNSFWCSDDAFTHSIGTKTCLHLDVAGVFIILKRATVYRY